MSHDVTRELVHTDRRRTAFVVAALALMECCKEVGAGLAPSSLCKRCAEE